MLRIYAVILSFVEDVALLVPRIAHHDPDLARQLRRSSASVALNASEGMYARGRSRTACYNIALREMRESFAVLEAVVRLGYLPPLRSPSWNSRTPSSIDARRGVQAASEPSDRAQSAADCEGLDAFEHVDTLRSLESPSSLILDLEAWLKPPPQAQAPHPSSSPPPRLKP